MSNHPISTHEKITSRVEEGNIRLQLFALIALGTMLLLPLHTQVFYFAIPSYTGIRPEVASIWKEVLVAIASVLLAMEMMRDKRKLAIHPFDLAALLFLLILFVLTFSAPDKMVALYGLRVFAEPILVYYIAGGIILDKSYITTYLKLFFFLSLVICTWAIFQAAILGDEFLLNLGYGGETGRLSNSFYIASFFFQRATGTFSSPNTFGLYLQISVMIGIFLLHQKKVKNKRVWPLRVTEKRSLPERAGLAA